jgi:ribonucleoside-diphosphate reductase alpha chain
MAARLRGIRSLEMTSGRPALDPISQEIWAMKYRYRNPEENIDEATIEDSWRRVALAVAAAEKPEDRAAWSAEFYHILKDYRFLPAGRILAGAGTNRQVTLFNCFVMGTIPDSLDGIFTQLKEAALTMQQGGGIGHDFSTIRPKGAAVKGIGADASGPISFMDVWDAMCKTIMSAGARRGAMMGVMRCDHPDIEAFIRVKQQSRRLRNFNLSVLVTDAFMAAIKAQADWPLVFEGKIYRIVKAAQLWDQIMRSTYDFAEPGVIFIDRINATNNLAYCETITATNPCGEQPLPPYGACLLGSLNLTCFIENPFERYARLDHAALGQTAATAVRFLDNVIDISNYPLEAQREEARSKRRIGLGVTGLADALAMCGLVYGTREAAETARDWMGNIAYGAYESSVALARERGPFPLFDAQQFIVNGCASQPSGELRKSIAKHGIRNAPLPPAFVTWDQLNPSAHILMQAVMQTYVDSAISKTINIPADFPFEEFKTIYEDAYDIGLKGCTTFRPNQITGSVLSASKTADESPEAGEDRQPMAREAVLPGMTYKLKWPESDHAIYITINDILVDGVRRPFEIFINSKNMEHYAWTVALTRMISAVFRRGGDVSFVVEELKAVFDPRGGQWMEGHYIPSLLAAIGGVIERHMIDTGFLAPAQAAKLTKTETGGTVCPRCGNGALSFQEGCATCLSCGYSKCS